MREENITPFDVQVCKYADVRMIYDLQMTCIDVQMCKYADVQMNYDCICTFEIRTFAH
jgi:hypothetical protein